MAQKVTAGVYKGVTTSELDELAAETSAALTSTHPDYATVRTISCPYHQTILNFYHLPSSWQLVSQCPIFTRALSSLLLRREYQVPFTFVKQSVSQGSGISHVYSVKLMYAHRNPKNGDAAPLVADDVYKIIMEVCVSISLLQFYPPPPAHPRQFLNQTSFVQNGELLDSEIRYDRDFDYDYFGFKV